MTRFFLEFGFRASLIVLTTAIVLRVLRIKRAAVQHAVWAGVVLAMLVLPAWMAWGPKASVPVLPASSSPVAIVVDTSELPPVVMSEVPDVPLAAKAPAWSWDAVFFGVYFLGAFTLLPRLTIGTFRANRLTSESCAAPVTVGLLSPRIILPASSGEWAREQLDAVLTHEREHARRRDPLFQWLALFNRAVFWFHPLAWWLERKLSALAEEACDAAVLERGHDPREYSRYLLDLARDVRRAGTRVNVVAMAMPGSYLPQRVKQIIDGVRAPRISRARMACAALACAIPVAVFAAGTLDHMPRLLPLPLPALSAPQPPVLMAQASPSPAPAKVPEAQPKLEFEVASVRPASPDEQGMGMSGGPGTSDPGRLRYANTPLYRILTKAYGMTPYEMAGPSWMNDARYDITAKIPEGTTEEQFEAMLQNLLVERFHLTMHREAREQTVYTLTVGRGGPKLKESDERISAQPIPDGPLKVASDELTVPFPGRSMVVRSSYGGGLHMAGQLQTSDQIAETLSKYIGARVVNETGLKGKYDFHLFFSGDDSPDWRGGLVPPDAGVASDPVPSVFDAVQSYLGLRLEKGKGTVEVYVIDRLDRVPEQN